MVVRRTLLVAALALGGCGQPGPAGDEARIARVVELGRVDLAAATREIEAMEDPVLRSAALLALARDPAVPVMPEQARALCTLAPTSGEQRLCWRRFGATHLHPWFPPPAPP